MKALISKIKVHSHIQCFSSPLPSIFLQNLLKFLHLLKDFLFLVPTWFELILIEDRFFISSNLDKLIGVDELTHNGLLPIAYTLHFQNLKSQFPNFQNLLLSLKISDLSFLDSAVIHSPKTITLNSLVQKLKSYLTTCFYFWSLTTLIAKDLSFQANTNLLHQFWFFKVTELVC